MTTEQNGIKAKLGLLRPAGQLGNVSHACPILGYSRGSFYRFRELYIAGGETALQEISRREPLPANRVETAIEDAAVRFATEQPAHGQSRAPNELKKQGVLISPGGVHPARQRHNPESLKKRPAAPEAKSAAESLVLAGAQVRALEKAKEEKEARGETETAHPGYLGAQDTSHAGTPKGVGRTYQQTLIDTHTRIAHVRLYDHKNAPAAAEPLNDRALPWPEEEDARLPRMPTDRGTEYRGTAAHHEHELYPAPEDTEHTKTKARHPQTNGTCERSHRTIPEESHQVAFRTTPYTSIEQLQTDVDRRAAWHNAERPHSGRYCDGRTPRRTWAESKEWAQAKTLERRYEPPDSAPPATPAAPDHPPVGAVRQRTTVRSSPVHYSQMTTARSSPVHHTLTARRNPWFAAGP